MAIKRSVQEQFGPVASQYAQFSYHAAGPDLAMMLAAGQMTGTERVLDIGSGPGHTALLFAPQAREVVASDPTAAMLDQGRRLAVERDLDNLRFELASAEDLPFPDGAFDRVTSRQCAHHFSDVRAALREVARVLDHKGRFVLVDTVSPADDELDAFLNQIELLRDSSHVRDYRMSEWRDMFAEANLDFEQVGAWSIELDFDDWVTRSRTPKQDVAALRRCFENASQQVRESFAVHADANWSVPIGLVVGTPKRQKSA